MIAEKDYEAATLLYGELLKKGYLPMNHDLVHPFKEEEGVRVAIKKMARLWRTAILEHEEHLHLVAEPEGCIFATSLSDMKHSKAHSKTFEDKVDFYIITIIINTFFAEIESAYDVKLSVDKEGISYVLLEEMVTNTLEHWKMVEDERKGAFSEQYALAVKQMYNKWKHSHYSRPNKELDSKQKTKMGYVHKAMQLLEKEGLVYISKHRTSCLVFPKQPLYERMQSILPELERYQLLRSLLRETVEEPVSEQQSTKEETA